MTTLLSSVIVIVLAAWLISLIAQFQREVRAARRRGQAAIEKEQRLGQTIEAMLAEERSLGQKIENQKNANLQIDRTLESLRIEAANRLSVGRNRILVLHVRRNPGEKDWIVTLVCPMTPKTESSHPLAREWASGRDYLVFAKTELEAREKALRRFSNKHGITAKSVVAAPNELFHA